ncbi:MULTISPECIES: SidA/IucD/PvdA family monooxygenase [Actinomadura]|uniref:L-lysine N6-monooxygenase MbtG n=1 Tax=Actinomadura litoris TaxID=2678616 RepID=A0A7K1KU63_9ACTN|nr:MULTISPECIES: SidA/IucD/PvdA family monooxygenase [Actinomadura]MBT2207470.1 SidA/IucD/PvdA family monooxygenase [Actinomadura sp. NEAU-AAG7]MUN35719.1 SidA/IucD/PvdA family monooxygenase [Actinomadura litoris]
MTDDHVHSAVGAGFGPANLSLAVALEEFGYPGTVRFVERARGFQWQDEQLLSGTDIQNNPFRDLAMPRRPDSRHSFVNYLACRGKLTDYLHLNLKFPLRREYAGYLAWVAESFRGSVDYGEPAVRLSLARSGDGEVFRVETGSGRCLLGETFVLGTGRSPRVPAEFQDALGPTVFHSTRYLTSVKGLAARARGTGGLRVVVVGASQSAIEIVLDLLGRPDVAQVTSIHRGIGFRLKDTSPYSRRVFLPEFVDYFHPLPAETKRRIRAELRTVNYAACDQDVIDRLAAAQYENELTGADRLRLMPFSEVARVRPRLRGGHRLLVRDVNHRTESTCDADAVILATGFRDFGAGPGDERYHPLLEGVADRLPLDDQGVPVVARDYSVELAGRGRGRRPLRLFLNGLCEASHGMGDAGALAVLSARAADIAGSLMRYPSGMSAGAGGRRSVRDARIPEHMVAEVFR